MNGNRRTWIVAVPYSLFLFISGHDIADYINKYGKVAFESYDARVYLLQR
jgi:hypothetical protein